MRIRVLPPGEWSRLERSGMPLFPGVPPQDLSIVVVEDGEQVIGCLTVLRATHFEGLWIDPEHRNAGVSRGLLRAAVEIAHGWGNEWVFGAAADDAMRVVLERVGAVKLPVDSYVLCVGEADAGRSGARGDEPSVSREAH